jgi:hypothetical protein
VEHFVSANQFFVAYGALFGNPHYDVEMVRHKCVGDEFNAREFRCLMEVFSEDFFGFIVEEFFAIYRSRDAVIYGVVGE